MKDNFPEYYKSISYLEGLSNISDSYQKTNLQSHPHPEIYLERMQDLLDLIGNPEKDFKYIHITGTAGKGSVSKMVHDALVNNTKKSGLFTSPFVTSTIEKIQVGNKYIDPHRLAQISESLKPKIDHMSRYGRHGIPSYFEIIFAIALLNFKKENCEYVVLEVGLGGRYDATNIIKNPLITAITNIDLDHTQVLGKTKEKIAFDKAGIIKKNSTFFTTENNKKLLSIFKKECILIGATYRPCNTQDLDYRQKNMLLAKSICEQIDIKINGNIEEYASLPARFEVVERKPFVIIDGAHNLSKIQSVISNLKKIKYKRLSIIIAISADKDWKEMLKIILPRVDHLFVTRFSVPGRKCVNPRNLLDFSKKIIPEKAIYLYTDPIEAFNEARKKLDTDDALLITGSFYLAGDIRGIYCPEKQILKQRSSKIRLQIK